MIRRPPRPSSASSSSFRPAPAAVEPLEGRVFLHAGHEHVVAPAALEAAAAGAVLRVNAGGLKAPYVDIAGNAWSVDAGFSRSKAVRSKFDVAGTGDDVLFANRRLGNFTYSLPVADGTYTLYLGFTDTLKKAGKRLFNVDVEGTRLETDLDVFARAGTRCGAGAEPRGDGDRRRAGPVAGGVEPKVQGGALRDRAGPARRRRDPDAHAHPDAAAGARAAARAGRPAGHRRRLQR